MKTVTDTRKLRGHCSTQTKVEGMVLKAAWPWDSDSRVTNDKLAELDRTPLYTFLQSACDFVDLDRVFSYIFR